MTMKVIHKFFISAFILLLFSATAYGQQLADFVLVVKSESRLYLFREGRELASFKVVFGANPRGHKQQQGDERTPEGRYTLDYKNANSLYYKSIHISYPNERDRENARKRGVDPGGDIMVHGQRNGYEAFSTIAQLFNWTNGCIALTNSEMDVVWQKVNPGTPIEIRP
jgi:murein L,D-transpeptidase YafK